MVAREYARLVPSYGNWVQCNLRSSQHGLVIELLEKRGLRYGTASAQVLLRLRHSFSTAILVDASLPIRSKKMWGTYRDLNSSLNPSSKIECITLFLSWVEEGACPNVVI